MRLFRIVLAAFLAFAPVAHAQNIGPGIGAVSGSEVRPGFSGANSCAQADAFFARATISASYRQKYINLICGLVTDGLWTNLGVLYVFATQDTPTAILNLVSSSNAATISGNPTFTAGQGFTGLVGANNFINGPAQNAVATYTQNAAHLSCWNYIGVSANNGCINDSGIQRVTPNNGGTAAVRINETASAASGATANSGRGLYLGNRTGANSYDLFVNGVFTGNATNASLSLGTNTYSIPQSTSIRQISIVSMGGDINTLQLKLYNRFADYMRAVGQPVVP